MASIWSGKVSEYWFSVAVCDFKNILLSSLIFRGNFRGVNLKWDIYKKNPWHQYFPDKDFPVGKVWIYTFKKLALCTEKSSVFTVLKMLLLRRIYNSEDTTANSRQEHAIKLCVYLLQTFCCCVLLYTVEHAAFAFQIHDHFYLILYWYCFVIMEWIFK